MPPLPFLVEFEEVTGQFVKKYPNGYTEPSTVGEWLAYQNAATLQEVLTRIETLISKVEKALEKPAKSKSSEPPAS